MSSEQEMDENFPEEEVTEDSVVAEEGGDDSAAADADFTDEDWDDAGAEGGGDDAEAEAADGDDGAKKKKKKMNMMIIGAAAVVGLGVLYWQMSHKSVKLPPPTAMQAPVPVAAPTDQDIIYGKTGVDEPKIDKGKGPVSGLMNDPNLIKKVQKMSDSHVATTEELTPEPKATIHPVTAPKEEGMKAAPPMPAPITQAGSEKPDQPLTPMPQEAKGTPFAVAAATGNPEVPKETPKEAKETPKETAVAPPVKEAAKPIVDPFAPETPAKAPEAAKIPVTPAPVASIIPTTTPVAPATPVAPVAQAPAASSAELEKIVSKLDGIEAEVKSLRDSSVGKDELASLQAQVASLESRMNGMSSAPVPVHHQASKKVPKAEKPAAAKAESASIHHHKTTAPAPKWVLKSAQPGMAIVAKSDGQLVMIRPGDKVPGLGKVKTIAEEKGRWVVKGSAGTVTQ